MTLAGNIVKFGRILRAAGMAVGPGTVFEALQAVEATGIDRRDDFFSALQSIFVHSREEQALFKEAFEAFFRGQATPDDAVRQLLRASQVPPARQKSPMSRRVREAMSASRTETHPPGEHRTEVDVTLSWSSREILQQKDFETMTAEEVDQARTEIQRMSLLFAEARSRRFRLERTGRAVSMRATLRKAARSQTGMIELVRRSPRRQHPPIVALCDISGSMDRYSRLLMHFLHSLAGARARVHTFVFGTRLTNVTRHLRRKDVDAALRQTTVAVHDWSGGTRIGSCLREFNHRWSRRVLAQGATVLLITDGLDRDEAQGLDRAMERLHQSSRNVIWLNPLLRFDGFTPRAAGIRAILPHVDRFLPVHNLASLRDLSRVLGETDPSDLKQMRRWLKQMKETR